MVTGMKESAGDALLRVTRTPTPTRGSSRASSCRSGCVALACPQGLVEAVLEAFTDPGDLVFEPFCGSGTQLIAAERTGRRCCAVELDPVYSDVAVRRWEMATGRIASRIADQEEAGKPARRSRKRA